MTQAALLAAIYVVLTQLQNMAFPGSASWMIQFRVAESLCVLAFFTPAAVWGLSIGCLLFNLTFAGAMPLDILLGSLATGLSTAGIYLTRKKKLFGYPLPGMVLPAAVNGMIIGWELSFYIGGAFWLNVGYVALGELLVMLTFGSLLYAVICRRRLQSHIF